MNCATSTTIPAYRPAICKIRNVKTGEIKYVSSVRYDNAGRAIFILSDSSVLLNQDASNFEIIQG